MIKLSNIRIGIKLGIMSGLGVLLMAAMVVTQMMGNATVRSANEAANLQQHIARDLESGKASQRGMQVAVRDIRLAQSAEDIQKTVKFLEDRQKATHKFVDPIVEKLRVPENRALMEKAKGLVDSYAAGAKEIAALREEAVALQAKGTAEATARATALNSEAQRIARDRTLPIADELQTIIEKVGTVASGLAEKELVNAEQSMTSSERTGLVIGFAAIVVLIGSAVFGALTIAKPLGALVRPLEEIADGNFLVEVPGLGRKDEVGQIATAVGQMADKVKMTIGEIKASGREVTNASAEISTSTTDLSQRTEEQAASLEETSAAMEELSATVKKNAENAQQASQSATATRDVADRGGQVVAKAVEAMAKIEDSSRKISDIIGVIDEIARQTNLLALNAAVEAARAGEAGRGFAVVASEVRSLAQRSSQAAKDIKDLITSSNGQVKDGVELVSRAGASLTEIVESIKNVATIVADIANASLEQATGIEQINKALTQMDEVTQQNSALVEENAATAKTLEHQAKAMDEQVAFFQIGEGADHREPSYAREPMAKPAPRKAAAPSRGLAAPKPQPKAEPKRAAVAASGGGARRMQTALATAVNADSDWKEF